MQIYNFFHENIFTVLEKEKLPQQSFLIIISVHASEQDQRTEYTGKCHQSFVEC